MKYLHAANLEIDASAGQGVVALTSLAHAFGLAFSSCKFVCVHSRPFATMAKLEGLRGLTGTTNVLSFLKCAQTVHIQ